MGWQPSYRLEAQIYGKYLVKEKPNAKLCVLYQNDDFGKDYLTGLKQGLGDQYDKIVIKTASYESSDPTIDSQVVSLQGAGCDSLLTAAIPKFAAQTIRKVFDIGWKPFHLLSNVAISRTAVFQPAGLDKSTGIMSGLYLNDPADPTLANDAGMKEYRDFMAKYLPDMDVNDANSVYAFGVSTTLVKVLTQCGNDLSRENIMKQAASIAKLTIPVAVKGVEVSTTASNFHPISQMQLGKFNGTNFERFGEVYAAQ
jgi:branched-chain amino acid transport system substrate-binding protein